MSLTEFRKLSKMLEDQDFQDFLDSLNFCLRQKNLGHDGVKLYPSQEVHQKKKNIFYFPCSLSAVEFNLSVQCFKYPVSEELTGS